jgi:hypothetical protein
MKKILPVVLIAILLAGGLFYFTSRHKKPETLAAYVPENALIYVDQKELGVMVDDVKKSRVGQTFNQIDFVQLAKDLQKSDEDAAAVKKALDEVAAFFAGPIFKELFSKDFAFSLLPMDASLLDNPEEALKNHLLFVASPEHNAQLFSLLATVLGKNVTDAPYGGYSVKRFQGEDNQVIFAAVINDVVLMGFDEMAIHDSIDCYAGKKKSLSASPNYKKLADMYQNPRSLCFVTLEGLRNQIEIVSKNQADDSGFTKDMQKELLTQWSGLQAFGYGSWQEADAIKSKMVVLVDNAKLDPVLKDFYSIPAEKNPSLVFAPQHSLAYYWTNTMSLPLYWKLVQAKGGFTKEMMDQIHQSAKKQLGMELEDFLKIFDKQMTVLVQNTKEKRSLPIPDFSILVRLNDSKRLGEFVQNLLAKNAIKTQVASYKDVGITSLTDFPEKDGVAPVYAITNDYFMAATNPAYMKQMIDAMKEGHGLSESPGFKRVSSGMAEENNYLIYYNTEELVQLLKIIGSFYCESYLPPLREEEGADLKIVLDRVVYPLLDSLTMYSDVGVRGKMIPGQFIVEGTTAISKTPMTTTASKQ